MPQASSDASPNPGPRLDLDRHTGAGRAGATQPPAPRTKLHANGPTTPGAASDRRPHEVCLHARFFDDLRPAADGSVRLAVSFRQQGAGEALDSTDAPTAPCAAPHDDTPRLSAS